MSKFRTLLFISLVTGLLQYSAPDSYCQFRVPMDNNGFMIFERVGNIIEINGILMNQNMPRLEDLISWQSPCADLVVVSNWNCENPARYGITSLAFRIVLRAEFEEGCDGDLALWGNGYQKYGIIRIHSDKNYYVEAVEIQDECRTRLDLRDIGDKSCVDGDEPVILYAKLGSKNPDFKFPEYIDGVIKYPGDHLDIPICELYSESGSAYYFLGPIPARELNRATLDQYGKTMSFSIQYRDSPVYYARVRESRFRFIKFNFVNNIPLQSNNNSIVCFPVNSVLNFGTQVGVIPYRWPSDCEPIQATVLGRVDGLDCSATSGIIAQNEFMTIASPTNYPILEIPLRSNPTFEFTLQVNGGPERNIYNHTQELTVYHGFQATPINQFGPVNVGETANNIFALTYPQLKINSASINYEWHADPAPTEGGQGHFVSGDPKINFANFVADQGGRVLVYYKVIDLAHNNQETVSPPTEIIIMPTITITLPEGTDKYTFNDDNPGVLSIPCNATTGNPALDNLITWSMTDIVGSTPAPPAAGPNTNFVFAGLPGDNNQFGPKTIIAALNAYNVSASVEIKVFYTKAASNYPNASDQIPNWFNYWLNGGVIPGVLSDINYIVDRPTHPYGFTELSQISLTCRADSIMYPQGGITVGNYTFNQVSDIDCASSTIGHERFHEWLYDQWRSGAWGIWDEHTDCDLDWLPNWFERDSSHTDSLSQDTFGIYAISVGKTKEEEIMNIGLVFEG